MSTLQSYDAGYVVVQANATVQNGGISEGAVTDIAIALGEDSKAFLLDFKVIVTASSPTEFGSITLYRRKSDGPVPTIDGQLEVAGQFRLNIVVGNYYINGIANEDDSDTYYIINNAGSVCDIELLARARTVKYN